MKFLKEIKDQEYPADQSKLEFREAARGVFFDEHGLVPILFVSKYNYHKLPGGGMEPGGDRLAALNREAMEETGCEVKVTGEIGEVLEYRAKYNLKQTSYCYLGKIVSKGEPHFVDDEITDGFQLIWLSLDDAITALENDQSDKYDCFFMKPRDLAVLREAKALLGEE